MSWEILGVNKTSETETDGLTEQKEIVYCYKLIAQI